MVTEGLWEQIRVDHGTEFALISTIQCHLAGYRRHISHAPLLQTSSRQNLRVERLWVEVNQRINYPIKGVLVQMESAGEIDMSDYMTKFGVSWTMIRVIQPAVRNFVAAWNEHRIPGCMGGIPNLLAQRANQITRLDPLSIPTTSFAIALHEQLGGQLTRKSSFGRDPLAGHPQLASLRERDFSFRHPSMEEIMQCVLHGDSSVFKQAIMHFIELTRSYSTTVQP